MAEPEYAAGCRMPSDESIWSSESLTYMAARQGSMTLLAALRLYYARHHPPKAAEVES